MIVIVIVIVIVILMSISDNNMLLLRNMQLRLKRKRKRRKRISEERIWKPRGPKGKRKLDLRVCCLVQETPRLLLSQKI